jgi:hypothetical protein
MNDQVFQINNCHYGLQFNSHVIQLQIVARPKAL